MEQELHRTAHLGKMNILGSTREVHRGKRVDAGSDSCSYCLFIAYWYETCFTWQRYKILNE